MTKREWPVHELANYRIALSAFKRSSLKAKERFCSKAWNRVLGNALRLAEAVDEIDKAKN
jgi:hypothetical protein